MNIKTKFEIDQKVWTLRSHKAVEVQVQKIEINIFKDSPIIEYQVKLNPMKVTEQIVDSKSGSIPTPIIFSEKEQNLFASKDDLVASL